MIGFDENTFLIEYDTVEYAFDAICLYAGGPNFEKITIVKETPILVMSEHIGEPKTDHYTIIGGDHEFYYTRFKDAVYIAAKDEAGYDEMKKYVEKRWIIDELDRAQQPFLGNE